MIPKNHIKHPQCNFKPNTLNACNYIDISIILQELRNTFRSNG